MYFNVVLGDGRLHILPTDPSPGVITVLPINTKSVAVSWRNIFIVNKDGKCLKLDSSTAGGSTTVVGADAGDADVSCLLQVSSGDLYTVAVSGDLMVKMLFKKI